MTRTAYLAAVACLGFAGTGAAQTPAAVGDGAIVAPKILMPAASPARAEILLISDAAGWGAREQGIADALVARGAIVIGVDLPAWSAALNAEERDCVYLVSDIEALSHQAQRSSGGAAYLPPIIAGIGAGGAQALAIAAQTPLATLGGTVAVDPSDGVTLRKPLCTQAASEQTATGTRYALAAGALPDPIAVGLTPAADPAGRAHALSLRAAHSDIAVSETADPAAKALSDLIEAAIDAQDAGAAEIPLGLPLSVLEAAPTRDTMAVIYSGDGGWRDLDREVGGVLQGLGMPVIGVDSLRYFWSERTPEGTAADLARIIEHYSQHWGVSKALLIGYSFGADILPATYNQLPADTKARIPQISLLGLAHEKPFQISVLGWLGADGGGGDPVDDIKALDPAIVQCVYGTRETDDPCPDLKALGVETVPITGGHHFDGDYQALARLILAGLDRRTGTAEK